MAKANLSAHAGNLNRRHILKSFAAAGAVGLAASPGVAAAFSPAKWIAKAEQYVDHLAAHHTIGETFAVIFWVPRSDHEQKEFMQILRELCAVPLNHVLVTEHLKARGRIRYRKPGIFCEFVKEVM